MIQPVALATRGKRGGPLPYNTSCIIFSKAFLCSGISPESVSIFLRECIRSGYYTKIPQTGGLNNSHLFLTVLEAGSQRSGCQHHWALGEGPLPGLQMATVLLCPYVGTQGRVYIVIQALIPFMKAPF